MKYSLGLDIGTTSVGWAVLNEDKNRIEDLGVRIFERPENPKNGESLAKPRRDARSARRRLKRRRQRLDSLKRFFVERKLLTKEEVEKLLSSKRSSDEAERYDPYKLRTRAIDEEVSNNELFVALYHIAKRRGYKSNRKKVEKESADSGRVLKAINENGELLKKYQSVAKALLWSDKFAKHKRNKLDDYSNSFIREDFEKEMVAILKAQKWPDEWISDLMYDVPNGLFYQRPFMTPELIERMRGRCPLENDEPRAQKASYSFEVFRLAQDLAHVTYNGGNKLTSEQIALAVEKAKEATEAMKYKTLREAIGFKNDANFRFDYIKGRQEVSYDEMEKHPFCSLKFYHSVRKKCSSEDWKRIKNDADMLDRIGYILTMNKDDKDVETELTKLQLDQESVDGLLGLSFAGFAGHSVKALRKLTPHLLAGETYDKAVEREYPGEYCEKLSGEGNELPPLSEEQLAELTNPVVKRAISQTRKVVNAVIKKYGAPAQIKIECTNELAKSFKERKKIKDAQEENAVNNAKIVDKLEELGIASPSGLQITKYKLREQQLCKCVYCGRTLGEEVLLDEQLSDVDHVIPFSRCVNDGLNNKVVVCTECNREKSDKTPFERWGQNADRWEKIIELVEASNMPLAKKRRVLAEKLPKEEWNKRALNDTRYIMKFMSRYIKTNLRFLDEVKGKQKVLLPTGFITSYLRKMYHLGDKDRELNSCHHAVDACIVASVSQAQIQRFAEYNKLRELGAKWHSVVWQDEDGELHEKSQKEYEEMKEELLPWPRFDDEVRIRSGVAFEPGKIERTVDFRDRFRDFESYDEDFLLRIHPMLVSRMPKRSAGGEAHKGTLRSYKTKNGKDRLQRKRLSDCTIKDIENSVLPESDRQLYKQLKNLWEKEGEDAFKKEIYKGDKRVDKNGKPISPISTIKVYVREPSGILINHGSQFVNNGKTVCLNIYKRKGKYYSAPVFVHSVRAKASEVLPTPVGRSKTEKADINAVRDEGGRVFATAENGFEYVMSLYPNEYVRFVYADKVVEGYYVKYGITGGTLSLVGHSSTSKEDSDMIRCSVGQALEIQKMNISVLGDGYVEA